MINRWQSQGLGELARVLLLVVRVARVHRRTVSLAAFVLAVLLLTLPVSTIVVHASEVSSAELQTALRLEKPAYKVGELVRIILLVYNPSNEPTVLHFSDGCWASLLVEDSSGRVWLNETTPYGCDLDPVDYQRVTNQTTIDPRWSRRSDMYWEQNDQAGEHVPVPQDYVLTVRVLSLEPGLFAGARITILSEVQSAAEAWGAGVLNIVRGLPVVFGLLPVLVGNFLASRTRRGPKGWRGWRKFLAELPQATIVGGVMIYYLVNFWDKIHCVGVDCSETLALVGLTRTLSLAMVAVWLGLLALGAIVSTRLWDLKSGFTVGLGLSVVFSLINLQTLGGLWNHMLYYDLGTAALSLTTIWTTPFALWLGFRIFTPKAPN